MPYDLLSGIKVVELSMYAFAPASAAVLSDWGADVIKVVPPHVADPMMSTRAIAGLPDKDLGGVVYMWEQLNRGKRALGLDVSKPAGREILMKLLKDSDVFICNLLPSARQRFGVDVPDVQAVNPKIIYARASGHGAKGPEREAGGFDHTDFWARTGLAHGAGQVTDEFIPQPAPALGDQTSGAFLAGSVAAALVRRERTGKGAVVDVSLLSSGVWSFSACVVAAKMYDVPTVPRRRHVDQPNPLVTAYRTRDGRELYFAGIQTEKNFEKFAEILGHPELLQDPRFATGDLRLQNARECILLLDKFFAERDLDEWKERMKECPVPWAVVQTAQEAAYDRQVEANNYLVDIQHESGAYPVAASPAQIDEQPLTLTRAPGHGEHTEEILLELGIEWDEIATLKGDNIIT